MAIITARWTSEIHSKMRAVASVGAKKWERLPLCCLLFVFVLTVVGFASMAAAVVKRAAGLLVFRVTTEGPKIEYLLLQASDRSRDWTPPKGHAKPGESLLTTALRETEEETQLNRSHFRLPGLPPMCTSYLVNSRPKEVSYFLAELVRPDQPIVLSREHRDYRWCDFETALEFGRFEEMKDVLRRAKDSISELIGKT